LSGGGSGYLPTDGGGGQDGGAGLGGGVGDALDDALDDIGGGLLGEIKRDEEP
jgi:hypothetical protein